MGRRDCLGDLIQEEAVGNCHCVFDFHELLATPVRNPTRDPGIDTLQDSRRHGPDLTKHVLLRDAGTSGRLSRVGAVTTARVSLYARVAW